jgi:peptide/nickel transport system ATP-binding protein
LALNPLLGLSDVNYSYGKSQVLHEITWSISRGQCIGIAGKSASGKSTLARILTLHLDPESGLREVEGVALSNPPWPQRLAFRRSLQLVFQDPANSFAPHWTLRQIIEEAKGLPPEPLLDLLQLPHSFLTRKASELSGGQKRRLAIARALAVSPKLLVLDETLSGQDGPLRRDICTALTQARSRDGLSVVLVSHDVSLLEQWCDPIVVLDRGHIVGDLTSNIGRQLSAASFRYQDRL